LYGGLPTATVEGAKCPPLRPFNQGNQNSKSGGGQKLEKDSFGRVAKSLEKKKTNMVIKACLAETGLVEKKKKTEPGGVTQLLHRRS